MKKQFNQAHIELGEHARQGSDKVMLDRGKSVEWLNVHSDKPKAKFDLKVIDQMGNVVLERKNMTSETNRYGERVSLPVSDTYYTIQVDNVEGARTIDAFLD